MTTSHCERIFHIVYVHLEAQMARRLCIQLLTLDSVLFPLLMAFSTFSSLNEDVCRETVFKGTQGSHAIEATFTGTTCIVVVWELMSRREYPYKDSVCFSFFGSYLWTVFNKSPMQSHLLWPNYFIPPAHLDTAFLAIVCLWLIWVWVCTHNRAWDSVVPLSGKTKMLDVNVCSRSW